MTSNVAATSTTGLYGISSNVYVPSSAQQLLNLLYSNGNVNFSLSPNSTQVQANALVSGGGAVSGSVVLTGDVTASGNTGTPIATTLAATGVVAGTYGSDSIIPRITVDAKGRVTTISNVGAAGGSYGNANVAAYLPTYTGSLANSSTIVAIDANLGTATTNITTLFANAGTQAGQIQTINANLGAFQTYANATFSTGGGSSYGNANVAAFLPTYTGNISAGNASITNLTTSGNVKSTGGYFWANGAVYGVTRVISGANIIISPAGGTGDVTISSTGVATGTSTGYYGSFYDTTDQYANVATQSYTWNIGQTSAQNGVSIVNGNAISFAYTGVYNVQFSAQLINTDSTQHEANIWIRQNGVDVADTCTQITVPSRSGVNKPGTIVPAWNYVLPVNANDTIQFVWQQSSGADVIYINSEVSGTSPTRPAIPGIIVTATQVTSVTNAYGNANVASFMANFGSNVITTTGQATLGNVVSTAGYFWANGTPYATSGGSYGNTQVAAFLPTYTGALQAASLTGLSSTNLTIRPGGTARDVQILGTSGGSSNILMQTSSGEIVIDSASGTGSFGATIKSAALISLLAPNVTTNGQFTSTGGYYWSNGAPYLGSGGGSTYGNANVAAYLPTYTGDLGGVLRSGNVYSTGTVVIQSAPAQTVFLASGAGANVFVTADGYLDLTGNLGIVINATPRVDINDGNLRVYRNASVPSTSGYIYADNNIQAGGNIISNNYLFANGVSILGSSSTYGNVDVTAFLNGTAPVNYITGTGNNLNLVGGANSTGSGAILQMGAGTIGGFAGPVAYFNSTNVAVNNGYFSTSLGPRIDDVMYDTVKGRLFANAFPLSTPNSTVPGNGLANYVKYTPVYTNGQLQPPPLANATVDGASVVNNSGQTVGLVQTSNIALQSAYGFAAQNRNTVGSTFLLSVTPVTANALSNQDRVRSVIAEADVLGADKTWGAMSTTSQNATTINGINSQSVFSGNGSIGALAGAASGTFVTPSSTGTANVQYATGVVTFTTLSGTAGTSAKANVVYSRGVAPFISGFSSNLTVQYAVGLHTYSGWAGTGTVGSASNPILGRFAVLNEDANTTIQSNGNLVITGNTSLNAIQETQAANGNISGTVSFSYYTGTVKTATLTGNITVNTNNITNMPVGGTMTLILRQDATGSRTLTSNIKFAGGSKTLSTAANAIDTISIYNDGTDLLAALVKGYA